MSRARRRALLLAGIAALLAVNGCFGSLDLSSGPDPQWLTGLCADNACATMGSARQTTGITSDTIGFQLGPGAGSVLIPSVPGDLSILARGYGTFSAELLGGSTVERDIPKDYGWVDIGGSDDGGVSNVRFSVSGDGSRLHIADLRVTLPAGHCSVAPAGPR